MSISETSYTGGCHCGAVRYTVRTSLEGVIACNCSICSKAGWLLTFVPETAFTLETGDDALRDYQFAKKQIHHLFCRHCGVRSFGWGHAPDGHKMYSINVRCLEGVDTAVLPVQEYDGASL
ncbi:MAG TPA: GFA family protein [Nannocystis exedens]|nr:GFA family protein [Nannocystis exedens]